MLAQLSSERRESVARNSRFPETDTSFCEPGQSTSETIFGLFLVMSQTRKPL